MKTKKLAKMAVALKTCETLHKEGMCVIYLHLYLGVFFNIANILLVSILN